jgi:hypothetical protein
MSYWTASCCKCLIDYILMMVPYVISFIPNISVCTICVQQNEFLRRMQSLCTLQYPYNRYIIANIFANSWKLKIPLPYLNKRTMQKTYLAHIYVFSTKIHFYLTKSTLLISELFYRVRYSHIQFQTIYCIKIK